MHEVTFNAIRRSSLDTPDAYCICHPDNSLKVIHLPKSETSIQKTKVPAWWSVTIPVWLAEKHDLY